MASCVLTVIHSNVTMPSSLMARRSGSGRIWNVTLSRLFPHQCHVALTVGGPPGDSTVSQLRIWPCFVTVWQGVGKPHFGLASGPDGFPSWALGRGWKAKRGARGAPWLLPACPPSLCTWGAIAQPPGRYPTRAEPALPRPPSESPAPAGQSSELSLLPAPPPPGL